MFFNVYLERDGSVTYGFGHPTAAYARAVRHYNGPHCKCIGVMRRK